MDATMIADRAILRGAVQGQFTCQKTGVVLDIRTAIMAEAKLIHGGTSVIIVHADAWEAGVKDSVETVRRDPDVTSVTVYDGRELFGRKPRGSRS